MSITWRFFVQHSIQAYAITFSASPLHLHLSIVSYTIVSPSVIHHTELRLSTNTQRTFTLSPFHFQSGFPRHAVRYRNRIIYRYPLPSSTFPDYYLYPWIFPLPTTNPIRIPVPQFDRDLYWIQSRNYPSQVAHWYHTNTNFFAAHTYIQHIVTYRVASLSDKPSQRQYSEGPWTYIHSDYDTGRNRFIR